MYCCFSHYLRFAKNLIVVLVVTKRNGFFHHNVVVEMMTLVGTLLTCWSFFFLDGLLVTKVVVVAVAAVFPGSLSQYLGVPPLRVWLDRVVAPPHSVPLPGVRARVGLLCRIHGTKGRDARYPGEAHRRQGRDHAFRGLPYRTTGHRQGLRWHLLR